MNGKYALVPMDELLMEDGIKGWLSIAILDNRTSAICIGYNNRFYTKKKYGTRDNVPSPPPRHPN
jgi:hypothetical protein